ncbi:MAG: sn-glycerol-3-phosphate ABC transporter ATP-binding protein UgpC [Eubacteriales bacterium]
MANVIFKGLKKVYEKNVIAVQEFNLEVADKEFVVLVGPSGCGKSTTLRMVAGLEEISSGELLIGDKTVNDVAPKDRDIAMVFQNYALYPHMTVYENMAFALKLRHVPKIDIDKKVKEAAEILGITDLLERKPKALSGGQRQRVAIGRAIVREPQVFLMDEPLSNLDAKLRAQMRTELIKIRKRVDTTFIYVTHDQTEAMTLGDRIVIMKDGYIQQIGTPQEVFNHPATIFVAGFIGSPQMNFFDAKLEKENNQYFVRVFGVKIPLVAEMNTKLQAKGFGEQNITLGIRPEHISFVTRGEQGAIHANVDLSEMMGSEMYIHLTIGEKDVVVRVSTIDLDEKYRRGIGYCAEIDIMILPALIHLFFKENETNLLL